AGGGLKCGVRESGRSLGAHPPALGGRGSGGRVLSAGSCVARIVPSPAAPRSRSRVDLSPLRGARLFLFPRQRRQIDLLGRLLIPLHLEERERPQRLRTVARAQAAEDLADLAILVGAVDRDQRVERMGAERGRERDLLLGGGARVVEAGRAPVPHPPPRPPPHP